MTDRQVQGWGNPDNILFRLRHVNTSFKHNGRPFPGGVNRKIVKLAHALLNDLEKAGFVIPPVGNWGWANRDIRGRPGVKSNHAWALALDTDAPHNPMGYGPVHTTLPHNSGEIAKCYGFIWGGDYTGRKDPMHFEFMGTPADAKRLTAALKSIPPKPVPQPPKPTFTKGNADVDWVRIKQGDTGRKVLNVQALLHSRDYPIVQDGTFGPGMAAHVKTFQRKHGLAQTGEVGPRTYKALLDANME